MTKLAFVFSVIFASTYSLASVTTTNYTLGNQINIAGSTALANQSVPAIHAYAISQGYTLVAADKMDPIANNAANVTMANLQGTKIALWTKVVTNTTGNKATVATNSINMHLIGSEGGTLITSSKLPGKFLPLTATGQVAPDVTGAGGQGYIPSSAVTVDAAASITFSDVDQSVGRFNTSKASPVKCVPLTEVAKLAAINFTIVAPGDFPASNITDRQLQALLIAGNLPLSFFTGNPADSTNGVFISGRDIDSGTRVLTFTESGVGALASVRQYVWDSVGKMLNLSVSNSVNGISYTTGNGGYFSGGDLCAAIAESKGSITNGAVLNGNYSGSCYLLGYVSADDLISRYDSGNIKALSYNGVQPYATNGTACGFQGSNNVIANGTYSLWSVARLYKNEANAPKGTEKAVIAALATSVANAILAKPTSSLGYGYTALGDLKVRRSYEGATIFVK